MPASANIQERRSAAEKPRWKQVVRGWCLPPGKLSVSLGPGGQRPPLRPPTLPPSDGVWRGGDVEENSWPSGASWRLVDWRSFPGCCSGPGVSGDQDGVRNPRPAGRQAEDGETARRLGSRLGLIRVSVCLVFGVCHLSFRVRRPPVLARVKGRSDVIPRTACVFSSSRSRAAQSNSPSGVLTGHAGVHN